LLSANCKRGQGGWRQEEQSIIGETAEYFRCRYFLDKIPFS
jgi:hypothetical protein